MNSNYSCSQQLIQMQPFRAVFVIYITMTCDLTTAFCLIDRADYNHSGGSGEDARTHWGMVADKRLFDLRREAGRSIAILASVEAQLAAEGDGEPFY